MVGTPASRACAIAVSAALQLLVVTVPFLRPIFQVTPVPSARHWLLIALLAAAPVTVVEVVTLIGARAQRSGAD